MRHACCALWLGGQASALPISGYKPGKRGDIQIQGVGNLMTQMAGCCQPLTGDAIVGYITQGRGVSIHRQDCDSVLQLAGRAPERIIQVSWGPVPVVTRSEERRVGKEGVSTGRLRGGAE